MATLAVLKLELLAAIVYRCRLLHDDRHFVLIGAHEPLRQARVT